MSVNVYLNNEVRDLPGFKSQPYSDGSGDQLTFNGLHLCKEADRLYFMLKEWGAIPDELKDLVDEISCHEAIPQMSHRETGIYRHESAECELVPGDYGNAKREKLIYKLKITAKNLEDIKVILHKVKTGTIRPTESYEANQSGKTRQQLESELLESKKHFNVMKEIFEDLKQEQLFTAAEVEMKHLNLLTLAMDMSLSKWPLVRSSTVAKKIKEILNR